jgi:hypothetical protein
MPTPLCGRRTDQTGTNSGFSLGQFVLHFASPLSEKVSYFGEVSFTAQPSAYDLQVERSIIRYDYNDFFKLSFGKYHTPVGYRIPSRCLVTDDDQPPGNGEVWRNLDSNPFRRSAGGGQHSVRRPGTGL